MLPIRRRLSPSQALRNSSSLFSKTNASVRGGVSNQCALSFLNGQLGKSQRGYYSATASLSQLQSRSLRQTCNPWPNRKGAAPVLAATHHDLLTIRLDSPHNRKALFFSTNTEEGTQGDVPDGSKRAKILELLETEEEGDIDKAFGILQDMIRQYDATTTTATQEREKPDNALLEALLHKLTINIIGDPKSTALQAQTIMTDMETLYNQSAGTESDPDLRPSTVCHSHLILLWSQAASPDQAERVFWEMLRPERLRQSKSSSLPPKVLRAHLGQNMNRVLQCVAASGLPDAGKRCDYLLSKLGRIKFPRGITVSPNPESYHLVLEAWQHAVEDNVATLQPSDFLRGASRVESLAAFMIKRYEATDKNDEWLPKPETFSWLIKAFGYVGAPHLGQKLLERLAKEQNGALTNDREPRMPPPTTAMYNHILESWARTEKPKEAALMFSKWVARVLSSSDSGLCQPDLTSCHLVIHAWGQFSDHSFALHAEAILQRMVDLQKEQDVNKRVLPAPTVDTYNAVLEAWSRSRHYKLVRAATNAERILQEMHGHNDRYRQNPVAPNSRSYELVIETYARFGYKLKDRKTRTTKLLRKMKHYSVVPTERCLELLELCQEDGKSLDDVEVAEQGL